MDVGRERERWRVMSEPDLDLLRVQAVPEEDRGAGVAERVESSLGNTRFPRCWLEYATHEVRRVELPARLGDENERIVCARTSLPPESLGELVGERNRPSPVLRLGGVDPAPVETPADVDATTAEVNVAPARAHRHTHPQHPCPHDAPRPLGAPGVQGERGSEVSGRGRSVRFLRSARARATPAGFSLGGLWRTGPQGTRRSHSRPGLC